MAQGGRISGVAVGAVTAGGVLVYAALRNVSPLQAVRDVLSGKLPGVPDKASVAVADTASSFAGDVAANITGQAAIVTAARKYIGVRYVWGGASPSTGFDCSGLVTYVLHHDLGVNLPSNAHTTTQVFLVWPGATTVPASQKMPGDLVCWASHIAIYSGGNQMIEAPGRGKNVRETTLRSAGAVFRRVKGVNASEGVGTLGKGLGGS